MDFNSSYKIGYVAKTHGLKGEVTIILTETLHPKKTPSILLEINGQLVPYFIEIFSDRGDQAFVKLEDVNTPEQAKAIKGCSIYLPRKSRPALERGEFYDDEVVGFEVEDEKEGPLGVVREVVQVGPNRLLLIHWLNKEVLIPVNGPFILSLNKSKKKFKVGLPDGFLEI